MAALINQEEKEQVAKAIIDGYSAEKIASKFNIQKEAVQRLARRRGLTIARTIKYCRECGDKIENDTTKAQTKMECSEKCWEAHNIKMRKTKYSQNYVRKGYTGQLRENRVKIFPFWRCEDCRYQFQLDFSPLAIGITERLRAVVCPQCTQQKTTV